MGYKEKSDSDNSNAEWTKNNIEKILDNKYPHGATGTNIIKALIKFFEIYHPTKTQNITELLIEYIDSVRTKESPLIKVSNYLKERGE